MGCLSSKIMTRSSSFREDLNQRLQKRSRQRHFPMLNGGDHQLLAIFCTTNSVSEKLHSESYNLESSPDIEKNTEAKPEMINIWELMADLDDHERQQNSLPRVVEKSSSTEKRSKSFHLSSEQESLFEERVQIGRSRSFHTVDEYDALMIKMKQWTSNPPRNSEIENDILFVSPNDGGLYLSDSKTTGKGVPRRDLVKELTSLAIPSRSTIEFPVIGSLREQMETCSPAAYATPKFGSFGLPVSTKRSEYGDSLSEDSVFDPELLSAWEEEMQQLKLDEESAVQQIVEEMEEKKDDEFSV